VTDLGRYQILAGVILCKDCPKDSMKKVVATFDNTSYVPFDEMNTEIFMHEGKYHEATFEDTASETGKALRRTSEALKQRAEAVQAEIESSDFFKCYEPETAYADGMLNGMGGTIGDMTSLIGPDVVLILAQALREVSEMDGHYDELIQDHNRKTCDDYTCFVFGYLVDIARAIDKQLE
jgi:hypothetical protein